MTFHCKVTKAKKRKMKSLFLLPTQSHTIKLKVEQTKVLADWRCQKLPMSCSQASRMSKRINQIILVQFLMKQKRNTIFIASALQGKLYWSNATFSWSFLIFYSAIFPKYSKSIIHSQFFPALCISYIQEVLWAAGAEPWGHSKAHAAPYLTLLFCQVPLPCLALALYTAHCCDTWSPQEATKSNTRGHEVGEGLQCYLLAEDISDGDTSLS